MQNCCNGPRSPDGKPAIEYFTAVDFHTGETVWKVLAGIVAMRDGE